MVHGYWILVFFADQDYNLISAQLFILVYLDYRSDKKTFL